MSDYSIIDSDPDRYGAYHASPPPQGATWDRGGSPDGSVSGAFGAFVRSLHSSIHSVSEGDRDTTCAIIAYFICYVAIPFAIFLMYVIASTEIRSRSPLDIIYDRCKQRGAGASKRDKIN